MPQIGLLRLPVVPASLFAIVLGLMGLSSAWRVATLVWGAPIGISDGLAMAGALIWAVLLALYLAKWVLAQDLAVAEWQHPVRSCFIGLVGVSTMLVGQAALYQSDSIGVILITVGGFSTLAFGIWRTGSLWRGGRTPDAETPALYLPTVAGAFVSATSAAALGFLDLGQIAFGIGVLSWLSIESIVIRRLYYGPEMTAELRPTLGIVLAPPGVCAAALMAVAEEPPLFVLYGLLGYALFQALTLARLGAWLRRPKFTPSYWSVSFGVTALGAAPLWIMTAGDAALASWIAPWAFGGANLVLLALAAGTVRLTLKNCLVDRSMPVTWPPPPPTWSKCNV